MACLHKMFSYRRCRRRGLCSWMLLVSKQHQASLGVLGASASRDLHEVSCRNHVSDRSKRQCKDQVLQLRAGDQVDYVHSSKWSFLCRVLFCNTLGCNNKRVPWSPPVPFTPPISKRKPGFTRSRFTPEQIKDPVAMDIMDTVQELEDHMDFDPEEVRFRSGRREDPLNEVLSSERAPPLERPFFQRPPARDFQPPLREEVRGNRRQSLAEEQNLLALLEKVRSSSSRNQNRRPVLDLDSFLDAFERPESERNKDSKVLVEIDTPR